MTIGLDLLGSALGGEKSEGSGQATVAKRNFYMFNLWGSGYTEIHYFFLLFENVHH